MKRLFYLLVGAFGVLLLTASACADRSGLATELHNFPTDGAVRVELRGLERLDVVTNGDSNEGELHQVIARLSAPSELSTRTFNELGFSNVTTGETSNISYISIANGNTIDLFASDRFVNGVRERQRPLFVNAAPGTRLTFQIATVELDCVGRNLCNRRDEGSVSYSFTLPTLPDPLPSDCEDGNTLDWLNQDGVFRFRDVVDHRRSATGEPIIEPLGSEQAMVLCLLAPR